MDIKKREDNNVSKAYMLGAAVGIILVMLIPVLVTLALTVAFTYAIFWCFGWEWNILIGVGVFLLAWFLRISFKSTK